jgi:DNA-binding NarL/FixJ family response regulator
MKIALVDDSKILTERFQKLLSPYLTKADDFLSVKKFETILTDIFSFNPDLIILNTYISGGSTLEIIHVLRTLHPCAKLIALTEFSEPRYHDLLIEAGANFVMDIVQDFNNLTHVITQLKNNHSKLN